MLKRQVAQAAIVGRATECLSTAKMMWNTSSISLPAPYDRFGWLLVDSKVASWVDWRSGFIRLTA